MDRNDVDKDFASFRSQLGDFNPSHEGMPSSKEHMFDPDRLDSGIESYTSFDESRCSSMQNPYTRNFEPIVTNQLSKMSIAAPVSQPEERFKSVDTMEDRLDSGFQSTSLTEDQIKMLVAPKEESVAQKQELTEEEKSSVDELLQWYLPDGEGDTYLQLAIIQKKVDMAFKVIQMCPMPELLDVTNDNQQTALHLAVLTDQPELVRCLVAYGANLTSKDRQGNTALHAACERGLAACLEMLTVKLDADEDPGLQKTTLPQNVNERNYFGFTPLHLAAINNHGHVVKSLTNDLHCDVNVGDLKSGRTALHHAVERRCMDATRTLLRCNPDVNALTYNECSALHLAAARGLRSEAKTLLDNGADLYLITRDDYDVFELATEHPVLQHALRDAEKKFKLRFRSEQQNVIG
ncbi:NF-kappa-B inhibitor epsilon-like [Clavelina lepadiformis]|uniref:NF-kappa-B inhibitor cactus n=1 Tax=Clavelina lepadiformis TaxID=159417 RepID=A0ABP0FJF9_CLALP